MEGTLELPFIYAAQGLGKKTSAATAARVFLPNPIKNIFSLPSAATNRRDYKTLFMTHCRNV